MQNFVYKCQNTDTQNFNKILNCEIIVLENIIFLTNIRFINHPTIKSSPLDLKGIFVYYCNENKN